MTVTVIQKADWVVAFDAKTSGHVYRRDCDVALRDDKICHVGAGFLDQPDRVIDGRGLLVMPGFVNIHSHPSFEPMNKGWSDEIGSAKLYGSTLFEVMPVFWPDAEGVPLASTVAYGECLLSGSTTVVDLGFIWDGWADLFAASGLRGVLAPMLRSTRWITRNGHVVEYHPEDVASRRDLGAAIDVIDKATRHASGRLSGMITPATIDLCTPELIRESYEESRRRGIPFQTHAAQSVVEFHEITRRHGQTPIEWLNSLNVLGPSTIIGHGIFLDHHPGAGTWPKRDDIATLVETGTFVAHCPTVFQRRGVAMRSLGRYLARGVKIGLGTDTYPHNMIEEMRSAAVTSRLVSENVSDLRTSDVFDAATLGGAAALGRDDLGRIAVGAKADLVLVNVQHPSMRPVRDPIRSLIYAAAERAVQTVFVDGKIVVENGRLLTLDLEEASAKLEEAQRRAESRVAALDWAGREHTAISPLTYRTM